MFQGEASWEWSVVCTIRCRAQRWTRKGRSRKTDRGQQTARAEPALKLGRFKLNLHCLFPPLNLCSSIAKKDLHISSVDTDLVPHPRPVGTHYPARRAAPRVARSVSCHFAMLGSCKRVARRLGGGRYKVKATAGTRGLITAFGASRLLSAGAWWLSHMLIVLEILENNVTRKLE